MEERIIENERGIRLKRKKEGTDVEDALSEETGEEEIPEEEVILDIPEDEELPEDLVGLSPTQLKEELERREKAQREAQEASEKLNAEGEEKLAERDYAEAESLFVQAMFQNVENVQAAKNLWIARTKNFKDTEAFYKKSNAEEFAYMPEEVRAFVLEKIDKRLKEEREIYRKEEAPLREKVEAKQEERREPFLANYKYYRNRVIVFLILCIAFALGAFISMGSIYSSTGVAAVVCTAVFGALAVIALVVVILYAQKTVAASRLCRANEELSSTEEGTRLEWLQSRLKCLETLFGENKD